MIAALEQWLDAIHVTRADRALSVRHDYLRRPSGRDRQVVRLDALVVTALPNILYLTNFTGSCGDRRSSTPGPSVFHHRLRYVTVMADARGTPHECPGSSWSPWRDRTT